MADGGMAPGIAVRLRVGVSGHRTAGAALPGLTGEVSKAVEYISQKLAVSPDVPLTVVSSLAEGADRVVADVILGREGARLEVVLPLPPGEYRADFGSAESRADFSRLLALDDRYDLVRTAASREHAYELAGRAVVDRSDVMIIIWDGEPGRGRGGTDEIREYALRWRRPIVLIRVAADGARLDTDQLPFAAEGTLPLTAASMRRLDRFNREPTAVRAPGGPAALLGLADSRPWLAEAVPLIEHVDWHYARADQVAGRQQKRFRLVNRLLYILAPLAVLIIAGQVVFAPDRRYLAWAEFGVLSVLTVLHLLARRAGWHARWLSARYLAEQLRSQAFLGLTGIVTIATATGRGQRDDEVSWTERAAAEVWLSRPRFDPPADTSLLVDVLYRHWVKDQQDYHRVLSGRFRRRGSVFQAVSVGLFMASAGAALLHSLGAGNNPARPFRWWDFLAIAIPAVAGALSGYAAQRDYARHAERSRLFAGFLDRAMDRLLAARNLDGIQQATLAISRAMRDEATDWYSAVHTQELELPA
ncbi:MAG TPA: DUF4231 domain-containing protein [Streptosporangiaceae bacterium]|nr:DUF4231 domain-containing protein [Streptosporangiaceae bacterium]